MSPDLKDELLAPKAARRLRSRPAAKGSPSRARYLAVLVAAVVMLGACSEETQSQLREAAEDVDTEQLAEDANQLAEGAGQVADALENAEASDGGGGGDGSAGDGSGGDGSGGDGSTGGEEEQHEFSTEDWILIVVLGLAAIAIIVYATSAATSHADKKAAATNDRNRRLGEVVGAARWIASSGANDILTATDPQQLSAMWMNERARYIDAESKIASMAGTTGDNTLDQSLTLLGQAVAGLRGAVQSYVSVRTDPNAASNPALAQNAAQTVSERRQQLTAALAPVEGAMR